MPRIRYLPTIIIALLTGCTSSDQMQTSSNHSVIVGKVESATLPHLGIRLPALMDTGAGLSVLDVEDYQLIQGSRGKRIRFTIVVRHQRRTTSYELPVKRYTSMLTSAGMLEKKPVVTLRVKIGPLTADIDTILAERDDRLLPVVIGRNFLAGRALVDSGRQQRVTRKLPRSTEAPM
ncbi:putative ATP-dependent zinc protease [Spongorhabdus nitratireducens]